MYPHKHSFVKYEGICTNLPNNLDHFISLSANFTLPIPYKTWPIYTLHKVTILTSPPYIEDKVFLVLPLTFLYQYTVKDLCHTMHTTTYPYLLRHTLTSTPSLPIRKVYIENLFAYCLDESHIYTALSLFVTF